MTSSVGLNEESSYGVSQKDLENAITVYDQEYFNGSQAVLYFGDILIDEVTGAQIEVMRSKTPIYGYASTFFDAVSDGHVIVRGTFAINFKESGYLFMALDTYNSKFGKNPTKNGPYKGNNNIAQGNAEFNYNKYSPGNGVPATGPTKEDYQKYETVAGFATEAQAAGKGLDKFEHWAESFEDVFWPGKNNLNLERLGTAGGVNGSERNSFDTDLDGFDMYIVFGNYGNALANHTTRKVHDVHLLGSQMMLAPTGEPIQEVYSFFAKNYI